MEDLLRDLACDLCDWSPAAPMWASTMPTSPEPKTRPSRGVPPAPRIWTGSDIVMSWSCDRAGNRDVGASDTEAFGEPDAVAPEVAASSVQAAAIATNTGATSRRVRTPRDTPAAHLELDTRRSATLSLRPRRWQLAEAHGRLRAGLIPFAMPR
jgi:hypothetical protein